MNNTYFCFNIVFALHWVFRHGDAVDQTADEWTKIKPLVVEAGYPRDRIVPLWNLIHKYHKDEFPNLITRASLALTAPIHTADCERGFSPQNSLKTSVRNRLGSERVDDLMVVSAEGEDLDPFDFNAALQHWRKKKDRRIFTG